jgi:hypothetical protein
MASILARIKAYQRQAQEATTEQSIPQQQPPQPPTLAGLPGGATSQQASPLQLKLRQYISEKGLPVHLFKFVPGLGEGIDKLLYGDPLAAHTFVAEISHNILTLLEEDKAFDAIERTKQLALLDAKQRANELRAADATTSGEVNATRANGLGEVNATQFVDETVPAHLRELTSLDSGLETAFSGNMGSQRDGGEQTL